MLCPTHGLQAKDLKNSKSFCNSLWIKQGRACRLTANLSLPQLNTHPPFGNRLFENKTSNIIQPFFQINFVKYQIKRKIPPFLVLFCFLTSVRCRIWAISCLVVGARLQACVKFQRLERDMLLGGDEG
jgi:hypothetical protein